MDTTPTPPTLGEARDTYLGWLSDARDLSTHTVRAYRSDISALVKALGEHTSVTEIDPSTVRRFFDQQRDGGACNSTLRRRAAGIRGFFRFLDQQQIAPSPWPTEGLAFKRTRALPRALPTSDVARLLNSLMRHADLGIDLTEDEPLAKLDAATTLLGTGLMLETGLRVNELVSFRVEDLDLSSGSIRVLGKGRRERIVYLTDAWLARLTRTYLTTRTNLAVDHDRFLLNARRAPLTTSRMRTRLTNAARDAGLRQRVTPHMLRHTAATQLIEAGVNLRVVQRLLGHASLATTEIYTHVTDQALRQAIESAGVISHCLSSKS